MTPEAIREVVAAATLVPVDADWFDVERAREWEGRIRADQADRIAVELARLGLSGAAVTARHITTDPTW